MNARIRVLLPLLAISLIGAAAHAQHTLEIVEDNGPSDNRIDYLILGDGYAADEQDLFDQHVSNMMLSLFATEPASTYDLFANVASVFTVSPESGADHPSTGDMVDTYFDCAFDCNGLERLICCDTAEALSVAAQEYPAYDVVFLLVNDMEFGGSGGTVPVASANPQGADIPAHELGHSMGGLGDEYDDDYPGYECTDIFANVSPTADEGSLKWIHWVEASTPLPTPESQAETDTLPVGAYEGACYQESGWYRPAPNCLMKSLGSDFCPVCTEAMVLAYYGYVEPVDGATPAPGTTVEAASPDEALFELDLVDPLLETLEVTWSMDGEDITTASYGAISNADASITMACIEPGTHTLAATVKDATAMVRRDAENLTTQTIEWTLTRTDNGPTEDCSTPNTPDGSPQSKSSDGCDCNLATTSQTHPLNLLLQLL